VKFREVKYLHRRRFQIMHCMFKSYGLRCLTLVSTIFQLDRGG
jgi:hypothetical protein